MSQITWIISLHVTCIISRDRAGLPTYFPHRPLKVEPLVLQPREKLHLTDSHPSSSDTSTPSTTSSDTTTDESMSVLLCTAGYDHTIRYVRLEQAIISIH